MFRLETMYKLFFLFIAGSMTSCASLNLSDKISYQDMDLDGVHDKKDACPQQPGSVFNLGCPEDKLLSLFYNQDLSTDSDLDGVSDDKDECPESYGSPFNQGCPFPSVK